MKLKQFSLHLNISYDILSVGENMTKVYTYTERK